MITLCKSILGVFLYISIIGEIVFFPSKENLYGCLMAFVCYKIFVKYFFFREIILRAPFAFMMFLSMFFYRYLSLIATFCEGKPITYGLELPYYTFSLEMLLFVISSLAFYFSINKNDSNNVLQKIFWRIGFFKRFSPAVIWFLGFIGLIARISSFAIGVEIGNIIGKVIQGLIFLMYFPFVLLYPSLLGFIVLSKRELLLNIKLGKFNLKDISVNNKILVSCYICVVFIINITTNSREGIIAPIALIILLHCLHLVNISFKSRKSFSFSKILFVIGFILILFNILNRISDAMLAVRSERAKLGTSELFERTIDNYYNDSSKDEEFKAKSNYGNNTLRPYSQGWNEIYIDNFILNRYANIRITDETLYHAFRIRERDLQQYMFSDFLKKTLMILPVPILNWLHINVDKSQGLYSRGDILYSLSTNKKLFKTFIVTSHVGDGIATFGIWYFPLQFILFFCVFKLLNSLVYFSERGVIYSVYGLAGLFSFLGMFRNAEGCFDDMAYCLRGYWQSIVIFLIFSAAIQFVYDLLNKKDIAVTND